MSSYQFVNSLAACYNSGGRGDPSAADYYASAGGGTGAQSYPNCYSPQIASAPSSGGGNYYGGSPTPNTPHHVTNLSMPNGPDFRSGVNVSPASLGSCKYGGATPTPSNNNNNNPGTQNQNVLEPSLGSPQDLTTGSGPSSAGSSVCSTPRSPPLVQQGSKSNNSSSNNSNSSPGGNNSKGGNPPQIYPWMKRVHLGQSKL